MQDNNQLILDFPVEQNYSAASFVVLPSHRQLMSALEGFTRDSTFVGTCYGERGTGKTHLLHYWCQSLQTEALFVESGLLSHNNMVVQQAIATGETRCFAVDNVEKLQHNAVGQETLFHLLNYAKNNNGKVLLASQVPPAQLQVMPELVSRMLLGSQLPLPLLQENDLRILLVKWAYDRQLVCDKTVVAYLLRHAERSPYVLQKMVQQLDKLSLAEKRRISVPLVKQVLQQMPLTGRHTPS